jgi:hypothetical protein
MRTEFTQIYLYETIDSKKEGYIKIGMTSRINVRERINEQFRTASNFNMDKNKKPPYDLLHSEDSKINNTEEYFTDKDIHSILKQNNRKVYVYKENDVNEDLNGNLSIKEYSKETEYYQTTKSEVIQIINYLKSNKTIKLNLTRPSNFGIREEQQDAVNKTSKYFHPDTHNISNTKEFLWNAKMGFGKTFSTYKLMEKMKWNKIIIITYMPSVEDSWRNDLNEHQDFEDYVFISSKSSIDSEIEDYTRAVNENKKIIYFLSFQNINSNKDREKEILTDIVYKEDWDCIVLDEYHFGVHNEKSTKELEEDEENEEELDNEDKKIISESNNKSKNIKSRNKLYLSGTPFKAIESGKFDKNIYNWTYVDEQKKKEEYIESNKTFLSNNPYLSLPKIKMFVFEIGEEIKDISIESKRNEFNLIDFFQTHKAKDKDKLRFKNEYNVISFILNLYNSKNVKSEKELFLNNPNETEYIEEFHYNIFTNKNLKEGYLNHTLWAMSSVDACFAMKELLERENVNGNKNPFHGYKIINVSESSMGNGFDTVKRLKDKMDGENKTITLTYKKLGTGVTVKEWGGILFLNELKSAESYFQTAFRVQRQHIKSKYNKEKNLIDNFKEECYIFDFNPNRSIELISEYSVKTNKLGLNKQDVNVEDTINEMLHFLPVLRFDDSELKSYNTEEMFGIVDGKIGKLNALEIAEKFDTTRNIKITDDMLLNKIKTNQKVLDIINSINYYAKTNDKDGKKSEVTISEDEDIVNKKSAVVNKGDKDKKELTQAEKDEIKEINDDKDFIKERVKTLISRIPLFMYLTNKAEKDMYAIFNTNDKELFKKVTGIEVEDMKLLDEIGIIKITNVDGFIRQFQRLEDKGFELVFSEIIK